MTTPLFRPQVSGQQGERLRGLATGLNPVSLSWLCWLIVALASTAVVCLLLGRYPRSVEVGGVLVANHGMIDVKAPVGGIVSKVPAGTGESVVQGDLLLTLQPDTRQVAGQRVAVTQLAENRRQQTLLDQRMAGLANTFSLKQTQARSRREALMTRLEELAGLQDRESAILVLEQSRLARLQTLHDRQLVAAERLEQAAMAVMKQERVQLRNAYELEDARRQLADTRAELALLESDFERDQAELALRKSALVLRQAELNADIRQDVTAPVSGTIALMLVKQGQHVSAGQALGSIEHAGSRLQAELYVPSRAIGFLAEGQPVNLRLDAFPYQKFGMPVAEISEIAGSVVAMGEQGGSAQGAFYRVTAELVQQHLDGYGKQLSLRAGMELRASIRLEQRSLLAWLFEPLLVNGRFKVGH